MVDPEPFPCSVSYFVLMNKAQISEIIALAWDYETAFDAIERQFALSAGEVIKLMRLNMKPSSFRIWRKRVSGRKTKHGTRRS